jgi:hypothetical protein
MTRLSGRNKGGRIVAKRLCYGLSPVALVLRVDAKGNNPRSEQRERGRRWHRNDAAWLVLLVCIAHLPGFFCSVAEYPPCQVI